MTTEQRGVLRSLYIAMYAASECELLEILVQRAPITGTVSLFYITVMNLMNEENAI